MAPQPTTIYRRRCGAGGRRAVAARLAENGASWCLEAGGDPLADAATGGDMPWPMRCGCWSSTPSRPNTKACATIAGSNIPTTRDAPPRLARRGSGRRPLPARAGPLAAALPITP